MATKSSIINPRVTVCASQSFESELSKIICKASYLVTNPTLCLAPVDSSFSKALIDNSNPYQSGSPGLIYDYKPKQLAS